MGDVLPVAWAEAWGPLLAFPPPRPPLPPVPFPLGNLQRTKPQGDRVTGRLLLRPLALTSQSPQDKQPQQGESQFPFKLAGTFVQRPA